MIGQMFLVSVSYICKQYYIYIRYIYDITDEKFAFFVPSVQAALCLLYAARESACNETIQIAEEATYNVLRCNPVCYFFNINHICFLIVIIIIIIKMFF